MRLLTQSATLKCMHGGSVVVPPAPCILRVEGAFAMTRPAPAAATVVGCPTPPPPAGPGPCLVVGVVMPVSYSTLLRIDGQPACLDTLQGMTDHAGAVLLADAGQTLVTVQG